MFPFVELRKCEQEEISYRDNFAFPNNAFVVIRKKKKPNNSSSKEVIMLV